MRLDLITRELHQPAIRPRVFDVDVVPRPIVHRIQNIFETWYANARPQVTCFDTGVQSLDVLPNHLHHHAITIRRAVDPRIVTHHRNAIRAHPQIVLDLIHTQRQRRPKRR